MVRTVLDIILAVYLLGWAICLVVLYRKMTNPEFWEGLNLNMEPTTWPVWFYMIGALTWPWLVWKLVSLRVRYAIGKAALKIGNVMINSLKKGGKKDDKRGIEH